MSTSIHPLAIVFKDLITFNNIFLLSAPWIVSPTKHRHGEPAPQGLHPLLTASAYAIIQPMCLAALIWSGVPMWIALLAISPQHLWFADLILEYWAIKTQRHALQEDFEEKPSEDVQHKKGTLMVRLRNLVKSDDLSWLQPTVTAAASDAALVLFGAELFSYPEEYDYASNKINFFFAFFAMAIYLGCRFVDYRIAVTTARTGAYGIASYTWRQWLSLMGVVAFLYLLRGGFGFLAEIWSGYPILRLVLWPRNVEIVLDRSGLEWIPAFREKWPWVSPLMTVIAIPMQLFGSYMLRRSARED